MLLSVLVLALSVSACASSTISGRPGSSAPGRSPAKQSHTTDHPASTAVPHRPVIVIDPGHSRPIYAIDPRTGLNVSDYENEPEMRNVFSVAQIVAARLRAAGYRVVLTKTSLDQRRNLAQRDATANRGHADLALSIHDQAGSRGGIGFRSGNNIVYYQSVGGYRETPSGHRVVFGNRRVAALSRRYGAVFATQRAHAEHAQVRLQRNVGYNLGSRGLAPGNMWLVQLLSHVPWIYNEAGGNSAGQVGLSPADRRTYAAGLVASVERCVPPPGPAVTSLSVTQGPTRGGTRVIVHGQNFRSVTAVLFGTARGSHVTVLSQGTLRVTAPRHAAGLVRIRVRTRYGTSPLSRRFRFVAPTRPGPPRPPPTNSPSPTQSSGAPPSSSASPSPGSGARSS